MTTTMDLTTGDLIPPIEKSVMQGTIDAWADVSCDRNPLHVDPVYAATTRFGGTIAHGHIALGWLTELMLRWRGTSWLEGGELRDVRFVAPIRPGYTVRASGRVREIVEEQGARKALCQITITNVADDVPCVVGQALAPLAPRAVS